MKTSKLIRIRVLLITACLLAGAAQSIIAQDAVDNGKPKRDDAHANLQTQTLVAWCIVPFDAKKRGPQERVKMLKSLGLTRVAYDWRNEHVASFEEEIVAYQKNDIEFFAFWSWHNSIEPLIQKHEIHPQVWLTNPSPEADTQDARVKAAAEQLLPIVNKAKALDCKFGIYNHGGWGGQPENMVAVCEYLRKHHDSDHVGIVYNLHHAHDQIKSFAEALETVKPYLLCLNLNGMNDNAQPKILPIGQGAHDKMLIGKLLESNYRGPIGILDHRNELDAEESLRANIDGLKELLK